jgi:hypothetical protein
MGSFVIIVPTVIVAAVLYFVFSVRTAEWFTWAILAIINIFFLYKSFYVYKRFLNGHDISAGEVIAMASQPFVCTSTLIVLVLLLFLDISKLHLFWFYPLTSLLFEFTVGKRAVNKLESCRKN